MRRSSRSISFTAELAAAELPVASPVVIAGQTLLRDREFRFAAFPYLRGGAPELDAPGARELLGRALARLHQVGARRPFERRPQIGIERLGVAGPGAGAAGAACCPKRCASSTSG